MAYDRMKVTDRQLKILRLLKERETKKLGPPTGAEMMEVSEAVDLHAVKCHLRHLRFAGMVEYQANGIGFRTLKLTRAGAKEAA